MIELRDELVLVRTEAGITLRGGAPDILVARARGAFVA